MSAEPTEGELRDIYAGVKTIAVVGASSDRAKAAFAIPRYLQSQGFRLVPVNPKGGEILGEKVVASLSDIDVPVDAVDVFRPAEEAPDIARGAVALGAKVLWLQEGIHSDEAEAIAREAGLSFVSNRCMGETHWMLFHSHQDMD
jgi:uncharacterized protein